ncbi:MAG: carotenoid oxygenase family protein, partial [Chlamydiales bacterium]
MFSKLILFTFSLVVMFSLFVKKPKISTDLDVELQNHPLAISGTIPTWLSGTLIRNGPVNVTLDDQKNQHWFDGLAMLHAFSFHDGQVTYSNRFLRTDAYQTVFEEGSLNYGGFAADPCRSGFKSFFTWFLPRSKIDLPNANVNVAKIAEQYVALTETPLPIHFDLKTLATVGVLDYQDTLPHGECWESAHPHHDSRRGETLSYLIEYGETSYYVLYRIKDGSSQREVIAKIPVQEPAYMHSFAVTENYVVFTEFPLIVNPQTLLSNEQSFIKNFRWEPQRGTQFLLVNRHDGQLV